MRCHDTAGSHNKRQSKENVLRGDRSCNTQPHDADCAHPHRRTCLGSTTMVRLMRLVENLGFGESLLQLPSVALLQGAVTGVLHQTRITSLEKFTLENSTF